MTARGIRNNNPGNIEHNRANRWVGLATPPSDGRFCRFTEMKHGVRALAHLLLVYQTKYKLDTIRKIITRWAPNHENSTTAYVNAVARGFHSADAQIDLSDVHTLHHLTRRIIDHENGADGALVSDDVIGEGVRMALAARRAPVRLARNATAAAAATAATATAAVETGLLDHDTLTSVADTVSAVAPSFSLLRELTPVVGIAVVVAALGFVLWRRWRR